MARFHHRLVAVTIWIGTVLLTEVLPTAGSPARPSSPPRRPIVERKIQLPDRTTKPLYLITPATAAAPLRSPDTLVIYASGDGGWFGRAVDMFREIGDCGYAAAGIGVHDYPPHAKTLDADALRARLADDYRVIVKESRAALGLPADRGKVILTGWSLGAAYAVLVASDEGFTRDIDVSGVIAWGLPDGREPTARDHWDPYVALKALIRLPRALIQSTGDRYTTAAEARRLSGPDTSTFTLHAIDARNHRFDEGMPAFAQSLQRELDRMADVPTSPPASPSSPR